MDMKLDIHIDCKACGERMALVTAPKDHQRHLHLRCRCMPPGGCVCVVLRACLAPVVQG